MKKLICCIMILSLVLLFIGCDKADTKTEEEIRAEIEAELRAEDALNGGPQLEEAIVLEDDEIITTYAYPVIDDVDVTNLEEVLFDAVEAVEDIGVDCDGNTGNIQEYKLAFFGEVNDVKINYSSYVYADFGIEIGSYSSLKDCVLTLKTNELDDFSGFFVDFKDGRGTGYNFIVSDEEMVADHEKIELVSGFTASEKTSSLYSPYDMSNMIDSLGMTTDAFENSSMMQYAEKEYSDGMDYGYYVYTINDFIKGVQIQFQANDFDNIISQCYISVNEETYRSLSDAEKFSFEGIDFDMSIIRGQYNLVESDLLSDISIWGDGPDSLVDTIVLYK